MTEDIETKNLSLLYSENAKVAAAFWEWRHKVMTRFFAAIAATTAMASWFYQHSELKPWMFVPFALAAVFSVLSDIMDRVNTEVLRECYQLGMSIEQKLSSDGGVFKAIQDIHHTRASYHWILRVMYVGSAILFAVISLVAIFLQ
jgi:hypothetical protein